MTQHYRGVRPATLVRVLEGTGESSSPYGEVDYVIAFERVQGIERMVTIGKVVPLTEEESRYRNKL